MTVSGTKFIISAMIFRKGANGDVLLAGWGHWNSGWLANISLVALVISLAALCTKFWAYMKLRKAKEQEIYHLQESLQHLSADLSALSDKNELLITEMHHRVKNNLQILSSLINSQLAFINNKAGRDALFHSKHRLYALSVVYQSLFLHPSAVTIDITSCIKNLVSYFSDEYHTHDRVNFEMNLVPLQVETDIAIPLAIIVNELISNSLKFAFPARGKGLIQITLSADGEGEYQLTYIDNGVGMPQDVDFLTARSLGKTLIIGLARQIRGHIRINGSGGMQVIMDFKTTLK